MAGTAIVAIPKEDDYVWKISSEKVPHLTLLFMGDQSKNPRLEQMTEYLQHVVDTSLNRFGLSVDRRGPLGPKNADVLFFDKDILEKELEVARTALLRNSDFFLAYNAVTQYPDWTPHLTLGFPETPAKKDDRPYGGISWIEFDRIALWVDDYDGPTFTLEREMNQTVSMSGLEGGGVKTLDELRHHGVKGQKWGVRKDPGHQGERATNKKIEKLDKNFEKSIALASKGRVTPAFHNAAVSRINERVRALNDSDKYRNIDINTASPKIRDAYNKAGQDLIVKSFEDATREIYGSNASGTKKGVYNPKTDTIDIVDIKIKHADVSVPDVTFRLTRDKTGHIISVEMIPLDISHSNEADSFLEHYGVKGQKWGVIRDRSSSAVTAGKNELALRKASEVTVRPKASGGVKTVGGKGRPASDDAKDAAVKKQVAKKSSVHALSNQELQSLINRMNLEQQFVRLQKNDPDANRAEKFINKLLGKKDKEIKMNDLDSALADNVGKAIKKKFNS